MLTPASQVHNMISALAIAPFSYDITNDACWTLTPDVYPGSAFERSSLRFLESLLRYFDPFFHQNPSSARKLSAERHQLLEFFGAVVKAMRLLRQSRHPAVVSM